VDVEVEKPHVNHHHIGEHWLDKALPVSAIFISLISIWIAYHHGEVMQDLVRQNERLVAANSLPHLSVSFTESVGAPGQQDIRFTAANGGVGPAEIRSLEMFYDGRPVASSNELLRECCGLDTREFYWVPMQNRMLRPGESVQFFRIITRPETAGGMPELTAAINEERIVARACYCSVFSDCWTRTSQEDQRPKPVGKQCPVPGVAYKR
jgi:hypothetical protein